MNLTLNNLLSKINNYNPKLYISQEEDIPIKAVKFLSENQSSFNPNYLYIVRSSNFPKILYQNNPVNILYITNKSFTFKYKKNPMLNLIVLDNKIDIFKIFNEIQEIIIKYQQFDINSSKLLNALISGKGIEHIVNVGYEILGNPICILDLSFKLIASSKDVKVDDPIWVELLTKGYCSYDFVPKDNIKKFIETVHKSSSPIFMNKEKFRIPRIISNIKINNTVIGYLTSLECEKPFSRDDMDLIILLCRIISSEMQKNKLFQNAKGLRYENLIIDLLDGNENNKKIIEERFKFLDLNFNYNLYTLVISVPQNKFVHTSLQQVMDTVDYMLVGCKSIIYNDFIVVLINRKDKIFNIEYTFSRLTDFFKNNNIYGGLSRCFHDIAHIKKYYEQSVKSIELGIRLIKNKFLFYYEDLAVYHLLEICSRQDDLKKFCHASIFTLIKYDKINNTDYVHCLYIYLSNEKNQLKTANNLNICRSTLSHRLKRIQQIMNIDLNNITTIFSLTLTFIIFKYIDIHGGVIDE
ncbi:PucR family transcriptional regulator [Clostridium sp. JNZ X4-2]